MLATHRFFPKIINGASQFVIPVFQRDYSWAEENCRQLWKDLLAIAEAPGDRPSGSTSIKSVSGCGGGCPPTDAFGVQLDDRRTLDEAVEGGNGPT